jgi:hypothetical protein
MRDGRTAPDHTIMTSRNSSWRRVCTACGLAASQRSYPTRERAVAATVFWGSVDDPARYLPCPHCGSTLGYDGVRAGR